MGRWPAVDRRTWLLLLAGLLGAFQFYLNAPALGHGWVYFDDDPNIILNPYLTGSHDTFNWAWTDLTYSRRYQPLGWLMFDAFFRLGGLNPAVFHIASWLIAALNSLLLFLVVRRFLVRPSPTTPGDHWPDLCAFLAVLLFSVHPLRAGTVGWASSLLYLGSTCFALLATLASFPITQQTLTPRGEWLGRILFLFSLLLYPIMLALPVMLILAASLSASPGALLTALRRYTSWLFIAFTLGAINLIAAAKSTLFGPAHVAANYSLIERIQETAARFGHYIEYVIWPGDTSPFYGRTDSMSFSEKYLVVLVAAAFAAGLLAWPRTRRITGGIVILFVLALLPFAGFVDRGQTASDRFAFVLLHVLAIGVGLLLVLVKPGRLRLVVVMGVLIGCVSLMPAYRRSLSVWRNTATMQARMDAVAAAHPDPRLNFARPALHDFLSGHYEQSQQRLRAGFVRFGANPELVNAAKFIEETRLQLAPNGGNPAMPPYATMHFQLARTHQASGHSYAAHVHLDFARTFLSQ